MIVIEGFWWFVGAILICCLHVLYLHDWRRDHRQSLARWQMYDARAQKRHTEFMRAIEGDRAVDGGWGTNKNERGRA